jgi:hypothetical protein
MALALLLASGVALAVNEVGSDGPDTLRAPTGPTTSLARAATTSSSLLPAKITYLVGRARTSSSAAANAASSLEATRTWPEVQATMQYSAAAEPTTYRAKKVTTF